MTQLLKPLISAFLLVLMYVSPTIAQADLNKKDSQGKRHGMWKEYYDPEKQMLKFEGEFIHGKETGTFKFYQEGLKKPAAIMKFDKNSDTVAAKYLSQKGKTISEGNLLNKIRVGPWTYYHKNSDKVMMTENYRNGELYGQKKLYYEDGTLAEEANYAEGVLHGNRKLYSVKGVVLEDLLYEQGELHGPAKFYNGKGELMTEGSYKRNKHHGTWRYYENGQLKKEKEY